jgi:hypothetical protein
MAGLSPDEMEQLQFVVRGANTTLESLRLGRVDVRDQSDREDKFVLWIVGLSAGAIAGVSVTPTLADVSRLEVAVVFAFFLSSILCGVIYRWVLLKFETTALSAHFLMQSRLMVLLLSCATIKTAQGIADAEAEFTQIMKHQGDPVMTKEFDRWHRWGRRAGYVRYVPPGTFFLGVLALAIVVLANWPLKSPQPSQLKPTPEIRQR